MNTEKPRVMILCGRSPRHLYVANRLSAVVEVLAIVHEANPWNAAKLRKLINPKLVWSKGWRWLRDRRRRHVSQDEASFFFGTTAPFLKHPELVQEFASVNDPGVVELADRLRPDFIAVFGTSLIRGALLGKGRFGMVNLHGGGLAPDYRGADTAFWALYNNEPDKVGCTLHYVDAGIDTGRLIAYVCPEVRSGDNEQSLFWRAVRDGADVFAEFFQRSGAGEIFGVCQQTKGRLFLAKDRLLRHERSLDKRLKVMLQDVSIPKRVTWFSPPSVVLLQGKTAA